MLGLGTEEEPGGHEGRRRMRSWIRAQAKALSEVPGLQQAA